MIEILDTQELPVNAADKVLTVETLLSQGLIRTNL